MDDTLGYAKYTHIEKLSDIAAKSPGRARWGKELQMCTRYIQSLVPRASVSSLASSRSKRSNAACKGRAMVVVQYSTK